MQGALRPRDGTVAQEVGAAGSRKGSGGASAGCGGPVPERERELAVELERAREALATKDQQLSSKDQELLNKDRELASKDQLLVSKDRELAGLRLQVRGVEVHDVDGGVSAVEERGDAEPPAKRVRREQDARTRVCEMYQDRLVEGKTEHKEEGKRQ